jgi:hypothetical protein
VERKQIIFSIREKLDLYRMPHKRIPFSLSNAILTSNSDRAALANSQLLNLQRPSENYRKSLGNWIEGKKPVVEEESHFLDESSDLNVSCTA